MYSGSCLCGGVQYQISGELEPIQICHCRECRKAQGTPFVTNIPVASKDFTLCAGEELLQPYESSPGKQRVFCRVCGAPVYSQRATDPGVLRIRAGTLNEDLPVRPAFHIFVADKANWWSIGDDLPQHDGFP